jgi:putative pyoverdin transport system ATP-binding/permease protein
MRPRPPAPPGYREPGSKNPFGIEVISLLLKVSWRGMVLAMVMGLVSGISSAAAIAIVSRSINGENSQAWLWPFVGLAILALVGGTFSQFVLIRLAQDSIHELRMGLSRRILAAPLAKIEELGASKILAALTDDVAVLSNTIAVMPFLCIDLAIIASCLVYLAVLSGVAFVVTVVLMVGSIVIIQGAIGKANHLFYGAREENDRLLQHFRSITEGIKELKLNQQRQSDFLTNELEVSADAARQRNIQGLNIFAVAAGSGQIIFFAVLGLLIFGLRDWLNLSVATLGGYLLTLTYLMTPLQNMVQRLPVLVRANVAIKKVESMGLSLAEASEMSSAQIATDQQIDSLELCQINHSYQGGDQAFHLGPIDLKFTTNELVFIVGGNGSGKSTLAKLLTGLYSPDTGQVKLNGQVITNENREWYRQHFSVVFVDFYLFNKLLGMDPDNLDVSADRYLELLQISHKVQVKDGQLSTVDLSQGQRKRLALLTAYLEDRPIYLFDEWAADQDPVFRDFFYRELLPELKRRGKLIFAISHDDRYFHVADRVIKLDYGQVESDVSQQIFKEC